MHIEHHRKRLSAPLSVPEYTNLPISTYSSMCVSYSLAYCKILMISTHNLCCATILMVHTDKVLQQVYQSYLIEYSVEECIIAGYHCVLIAAINTLPFHISVFLCCDSSCLCYQHITYHIESIIDEKRRTLLLILLYLKISILYVCLIARRRFQFYYYQWQPVHKHHHVASDRLIFYHSPLVANLKLILIYIFEIHQLHKGGFLPSIFRIAHLNTILKVFHKLLIPLLQNTFIHIGNFTESFIYDIRR